MSTTGQEVSALTGEEVATRGRDIFARLGPTFRTEDHRKFIAVDVLSGDYEMSENGYTAVMTLRTRVPNAEIWLERVGEPAVIKLRSPR